MKVEKYYRPKFEVFVRMPTFIFNTDQVIKAEVSSAYLYEKTAKGTIHLRWFAKKVIALCKTNSLILDKALNNENTFQVDGTTPLYNDTVLYRNEYSYYQNISNTYR